MIRELFRTIWGVVTRPRATFDELAQSTSIRPAVLLVQADTDGQARTFEFCTFATLAEATTGHVAPFSRGSDAEVRDAFLNMLLGPARADTRPATVGSIAMD